MRGYESSRLQKPPEDEPGKKELEQRLLPLIGKEVAGFDISYDGADVEIRFKDGAALSFRSWNVRDDQPGPEEIGVTLPKTQPLETQRPKDIEPVWGEMEFAPLAGSLRSVVDVTRNASLEERLLIRKTLYAILTKGEIEELKDFIDKLDANKATEE